MSHILPAVMHMVHMYIPFIMPLLPAVACEDDAMPGLTARLNIKVISGDTGINIYATVIGPM